MATMGLHQQITLKRRRIWRTLLLRHYQVAPELLLSLTRSQSPNNCQLRDLQIVLYTRVLLLPLPASSNRRPDSPRLRGLPSPLRQRLTYPQGDLSTLPRSQTKNRLLRVCLGDPNLNNYPLLRSNMPPLEPPSHRQAASHHHPLNVSAFEMTTMTNASLLPHSRHPATIFTTYTRWCHIWARTRKCR